jgi:hypothetical protein
MKKVRNLGINDSTTPVYRFEYLGYENGKRKSKCVWMCKYYSKWKGVINRCSGNTPFKTYLECTLDKRWVYFSNFKSWCIEQEQIYNIDITGLHIDKDFLVKGNKVYSPDTCVFISPVVNTFILDSKNIRGDCPIGVNLNKSGKKYEAYCRNPFIKRKQHYLGVFTTPEEAHEAWRKKKHEFSCALADSEYIVDERVRKILKTKYSFEYWYN